MEIQTKLSIGDDCYYLHDNKVQCYPVKEITIIVKKSSKTIGLLDLDIRYIVPNSLCYCVHDKDAFKSKQELLDSL